MSNHEHGYISYDDPQRHTLANRCTRASVAANVLLTLVQIVVGFLGPLPKRKANTYRTVQKITLPSLLKVSGELSMPESVSKVDSVRRLGYKWSGYTALPEQSDFLGE